MGTKDSVLIIDDDPSLRKTLSDILRAKEYAPIAVDRGKEALDRVQVEMPAVALIDLRLDDMSGLALLEEIRRRSPGTQCIVLTGHATQESAIEAINLGAYGYVQKPYDMDQLLVTIHRAVEKRDAEEALRENEETLQRLLDQQIAVNRLALALGESRDIGKIYHSIHEHIHALMDADAFIVSSYDDETQLIHAGYMVSHGAVRDVANFPLIPLERTGHGTQSQVIHTGKPFYVPDWRRAMRTTRTEYKVAEDGTVSEGPPPAEQQKDSVNSAIYVPMKIEGKTIGVMQAQSHRLDAYTQEDIDLLSALANVAAIAIQNARLYEETRRRGLEQETLREAALALTATLELSEVLHILAEQVGRALNTSSVYISSLDEETTQSTVMAKWISPEAIDHQSDLGTTYDLRRYPTTLRALQEKQPLAVRVTDPDLDPADHEEAERHGWQSYLIVPLVSQDRLIGYVGLWETRWEREFTEADVRLCQTLAADAAVAIEHARLFQAEREQRELTEALEAAAAAVSSSLDLDDVLDRILEQVQRVVAGDAFNIMLMEDEHARMARWRGYERFGMEGYISTVTLDISEVPSLQQMVETGEPAVIPDTAAYPGWFEVVGMEWLRSYLAAPIRVGGEMVGLLNVDGTQPGQFGPADAQRLQIFANHAATAIQNARLFGETRQRVEELEALRSTSLRLTGSLDLSTVLDIIVASTSRLVEASDCHIYLYDEANETFTFGTALWQDGRREPAVKAPRRDGLTATIARGGHPVVIDDAPHHPLYITAEAQKWNVQAIAGFPLKRAGRVLGVFTIAFIEPHTFSEGELRVLGLLADQAAVAIENAQLYREVRSHAERLEQRVQERTAQLQAQYARLDAILRSTSDGIVVTDGQGEILQANPVAEIWLTRTLSPEDAARLRKTARELARRVEEQPEAVLELTGLDLELKAAPISEPGLEEAAAVVAVHDVSHLKTLNRMKSRFTTNISHELRTPITTIKLYVHLMRRRPEKREQYLDTLAQETDHLVGLVEDILQISRIDAGRVEIKPRPTLLSELTEGAVISHQTLAQKRGVTLEHHPAQPGPVALVDPQHVAQALNVLVENSVLYTPEGGEVIVSTGEQEAEGRVWATATVADTGMGIPEEELPHIFDRFFRGDEPRSMQISGTGLGLAIVKEIVGLHGGRVTVESQVGVGTTFTVWLPLTE